MANTLTGLIPTLYAAVQQVSRELVGFIPAVTLNASPERAAKDQTISSFFAPASTAADITPDRLPPDTGDQTITAKTMTISKSRAVPIRWSGEEELSLDAPQVGVERVRQHQVVQALRAIVNEVEADIFGAAYKGASRATGTAGTAPFASSLGDAAEVLEILENNGAPDSDLQLVLSSAAATNFRQLANLTQVAQAGDDSLLRQGILTDVFGFDVRKTGQASKHTQGTGSSYLVNDASLSAGDTVITVDTGTGTILAGDVVTFAADSDNKYVVETALSGSTFTIAEPGLQIDIPDDNAITVGADHTSSVAFDRNAIELAARAPARPRDGDAAIDSMLITDPVSGITFEFAAYPGYRQIHYEVGLAWGFKAWQNEHIALILG